MADIRAFRGYRYDLGRVGSLSDVVAPPYDVIDSALQQRLYDASPFNAIRLELTREEPGDDEHDNKYTRAAGTLKDWLADNILRQDTARTLYVYEQEFTVDGQTYCRRGFLARVRLEPFGQGQVYAHEHTLSGPKADRLKLYNATHFNTSPIFGFYPDESGEVIGRLNAIVRQAPPLVAHDHLGVINRLWLVTDQSAISAVVGLLGPRPIFIADGHHRYETGVKYLEEQRAQGLAANEESPQNFCLMHLVGMSDPGLIILPTHRLLSGPQWNLAQLQSVLAEHFEVLAEFPTAAACWEQVQLEDSQRVLGFGTQQDGRYCAVRLRSPTIMAEVAPEQSPAWRDLAVSILHRVVIDRLLAANSHTVPTCHYVHTLAEVEAAMAARACAITALVPPCRMNHVETIAGQLEKMPPKSTYFYPKILTGMVFNSLKKD